MSLTSSHSHTHPSQLHNTDPRLTTSQTLRRNFSTLENFPTPMKYSNNTPIIFQAPRTPSPFFASRYSPTGIRIFQYSVCQYSSISPILRLSSPAVLVLTLKACMTASIPQLDWLECLWQVHIHIHTHHNYTASTMLILGWPLVKHLGEILYSWKFLNTHEVHKQHSNQLPSSQDTLSMLCKSIYVHWHQDIPILCLRVQLLLTYSKT